jgi:hypothetical protein
MSSNTAHDFVGQPEKPYSIAVHCLVLTLIGVTAIGVGLFLLPPAEVPSAPSARGAAPIANSQPSAPRATAGAAAQPAQTHPDYFSAQFPTPGDDAAEQSTKF